MWCWEACTAPGPRGQLWPHNAPKEVQTIHTKEQKQFNTTKIYYIQSFSQSYLLREGRIKQSLLLLKDQSWRPFSPQPCSLPWAGNRRFCQALSLPQSSQALDPGKPPCSPQTAAHSLLHCSRIPGCLRLPEGDLGNLGNQCLHINTLQKCFLFQWKNDTVNTQRLMYKQQNTEAQRFEVVH